MALFPAYSNHAIQEEELSMPGSWQENKSFKKSEIVEEIVSPVVLQSDNGGKEESRADTKRLHKKLFKKKRKHERKREEQKEKAALVINLINEEECDSFCIDRNREPLYLTLKTLGKPAVPRYICNRYSGIPFGILNSKNSKKQKRKDRYFLRNLQEENENDETQEMEMKNKIERFNRNLAEDSYNIELWLDYVNFQDDVYEFESRYKKHNQVNFKRLTCEKKLSILNKALQFNHSNELLMKKWLDVSRVCSTEEVCELIESKLKTNSTMICLWLGLANSWMCSLSRCRVTKVLSVYERALEMLHRSRVRVGVSDAFKLETGLLEILLHCLLFLSHAGLWEKLLSIIKMYIGINFNTKLLKINELVNEDLRDLEDRLLESGLTLPVIWYRVERLRQTNYFLPVAPDTDMPDPQRIVLHDDVVQFTYHMNPKLNFHLACVLLTVVKVPPLPLTHFLVKFLFLDRNTWTRDFVEFAYATCESSVIYNFDFTHMKCLSALSTGPQYIIPAPGQETFLQLIFNTFDCIIASLDRDERTAICIWMLRFERWLSKLNQQSLIKLPTDRKCSKLFYKEFLKQPQNRENLLFYREYALYEAERGEMETAVKILHSVTSTKKHINLSSRDINSDTHHLSVIRTQCEMLISLGRYTEVISLLKLSFSGKSIEDLKCLVMREFDKMDADEDVAAEDLFLPNLFHEFVSCVSWLISLTESYRAGCDYIDHIVLGFISCKGTKSDYIRECLEQTKSAILWKMSDHLLLKNVFNDLLILYPNNSVFISAAAQLENERHSLWWELMKTIKNTKSPLLQVVLLCVTMSLIDSRPLEHKSTFINRTSSCFHTLCSQVNNVHVTSLAHRLRLKFNEKYLVGDQELSTMCALENFPWIKAVYVDGVNYNPTKINDFTDLLVEKELRIHITPDEVEVMRD